MQIDGVNNQNGSNTKLNNSKRTCFIGKQKQDTVEIESKNAAKEGKFKTFFENNKKRIALCFATITSVLSVLFAAENKSLKKEKSKLEAQKSTLEQDKRDLETQNDTLARDKVILEKEKATLEKANENLRASIDEITLSGNVENQVSSKIAEISAKTLSYDPLHPAYVASNNPLNTKLPIYDMKLEDEHTVNRSDAVDLIYPEFKENEPYHFEFPTSKDMKITHCEKQDINSTDLKETNISSLYADSVNWDNDKIARDLMQNFFDGHGQTLDGVKFDFEPTENGKYKVRISGKSTYTPDKAILLGESSKKEDNKAAGCYGEGLKMVALKLLKDKGANNVAVASDNWKVDWKFTNNEQGTQVLAYQLTKQEEIDGNYLEFETNDSDLLKSIIKSFDRFYHYNNPAFKYPDFENDFIAIKNIGENEKGRMFIAGQTFETEANRHSKVIKGYEELEGLNIAIKQKPPAQALDPSRDRIAINETNAYNIGSWLGKNLSNEDYVKLVRALYSCWDSDKDKGDRIGKQLLSGILANKYSLKINFPFDKEVADSYKVSSELKKQYIQNGYRICLRDFDIHNMKSIQDAIRENRLHKPVEPTQAQKNQLLILKEAIDLLTPILKENNFFTDDELDTKIFVFDRENEDAVYQNTMAESIVRNSQCQGFWFDRSNFDGSFSNAISTALHELTHKYGGDESQEFSYRLTDVLEKVFKAISDNPKLAQQIKVLDEAWKTQQ